MFLQCTSMSVVSMLGLNTKEVRIKDRTSRGSGGGVFK